MTLNDTVGETIMKLYENSWVITSKEMRLNNTEIKWKSKGDNYEIK